MVARIGSPVDAAGVGAFNERHNSAAQRAWFAEHAHAWAATQDPNFHDVAVELVNGCRWLVRGSNAGLALPLAPKSPLLKEPCTELPATEGKEEEVVPTREEFLREIFASPHLSGASRRVRAPVYAAVYEFPSAAAEQIAVERGSDDGGTGAVLLLESLDLCEEPYEGPHLTCLPSGLDVGGSLLVRDCEGLEMLPQRVGWDLDASGCGVGSAALIDVGGDVTLARSFLHSMAECQLTDVRGALNLQHCAGLAELPPALARVRGALNLACCERLARLPDPLVVEGALQLEGCTALGALPAGLRTRSLCLTDTDVASLPSSAVFTANLLCGRALAHLPEDLAVVDGDLRVQGLEQFPSELRGLPARLREVRGDLLLEHCPNVKELPARLRVHGELRWIGDGDRLPSGLRVGGGLRLQGHDRLADLPDDISIGGEVRMEALTSLRRLSQGVRVVRGDVRLSGCTELRQLPAGFEVHGSLFLAGCTALATLPAALRVQGALDVSGCTALTRLPEDMVVASGVIDHSGCASLRWGKLLDWRDPADATRSLDESLPTILGFLSHADVRLHCALVSSGWAAAAAAVAPCAPRGCRGDWVARVLTDLRGGDNYEAGCHVEPTELWPASPHVRVVRIWPDGPYLCSDKVFAAAVASAQAPFFGGRPAAELKEGDDVVITAAEFGFGVNGSTGGQAIAQCAATVQAVDGDSIRLLASFDFAPVRFSGPFVWGWQHCVVVSPRHVAAWEEAQNQPVQEGVCHVDGDVRGELLQRLQRGIDAFAASQPADYHPHSNDIVRDHVHPAMYPFILGASAFVPSADLSEPLAPMPALHPGALHPGAPHPGAPHLARGPTVAAGGHRGAHVGGRPLEVSKYQWLPTYFDVAAGSGRVTIRGDINNLRPRAQHEGLYGALAELFSAFLPEIDVARAYSEQAVLRGGPGSEGASLGPSAARLARMGTPHLLLPVGARRSAAWQVITKIVDYELQPGQTYDGVWHVEGMSHEHIMCTCLFVLDRGESFTGGDLFFRRALNHAEGEEVRESVGQEVDSVTRRMLTGKGDYGTEEEGGLVPLGKVATPAGRRVVFPNSHVHRLTELKNTGVGVERRRIVAFFVVDPETRIVSTQECPDQSGTISREQALEHRLELMQERRLHKQDLNLRSIGLCEH